MPITLSTTALTTVERVKQFMGKKDEEPYQDQLITMLINSASDMVMNECAREFKSSVGTGARNFWLPHRFAGWAYINFGRWQCQAGSITQVQVDTEGVPSETPTTLTTDQWQATPTTNDWGVDTGIRIYTYSVGPVLRQGAGFQRQLSVTATWGWPSVPASVEQAVILTVATWVRRDSQGYSERFGAEEAAHQRPQAIPSAAWDMLTPYMKVPV